MSSRIEQIIEEIEEFVEGCKYQPLSTTKIVVNKEELEELLRELRLKTPDEVKKYQKIINNRDAILVDAQKKADAMVADAQKKADELVADAQAKAERLVAEAEAKAKALVEEHEITRQAYIVGTDLVNDAKRQAQETVDDAAVQANELRMGAVGYTDEMLGNMENILAVAINEATEKFEAYLGSMQTCYAIVAQNRKELNPEEATEEEETEATEATEEAADMSLDLEDLE